MSARRLAVEVVLDGPQPPAWQAGALDDLRRSRLIEVVAVRLLQSAAETPLRRAQARIERRLLGLGPDALARVSAPGGAEHAGEIAPETPHGAAPPALSIWLAEQPPGERSIDTLHLRHAGCEQSADSAFTRAVIEGRDVVESEFVLRRGDGQELLVERTFSGVRPFSLTLSRNLALWKLAAGVRRAAERLDGSPELQPAPPSANAGPAPSEGALLARSAVLWPRVLLTRLLFRRPWSLRVRRRALDPTQGWARPERLVDFSPGHLYADPMLFEHEGRHHLFCEEVRPGEGRAVISHTELRADGRTAAPPSCVLERPYHLSYPFVFAHQGELLMIPESSAMKRVELYRAVEFPTRWELDTVLIDQLDAADATLLEHAGRLWLFVAVAAPHASSLDELHLFSASSLRGSWQPHPLNPVVSDVRCARPAGPVQRWGSRLVRPGQDGSRRYGGAIAFCEIDELSESAYGERQIARLEPAALGGARATHSYSSDSAFEAIDLRSRELRSAGLPRMGLPMRRRRAL